MTTLYDISPTISPRTAVYPGDTPFSRAVQQDFSQGNNYALSAMTATLHLGAHTDAPSHYHPDGNDISQRPLDYYLGPCQVVDVSHCRQPRLYPSDLGETTITCNRVLFYTHSFPDPDQWNDDFTALSPELVDYLAERNVVLVGIDTPSIDPATSKALESHQQVYHHDMAILEGIVLDAVPPGNYTLVALPLKIEDGDASPVRAILLGDVYEQLGDTGLAR